MGDVRNQEPRHTFVVDGPYLREQARQALFGFFLPVSGVVQAVTSDGKTRQKRYFFKVAKKANRKPKPIS